MDYLLRWDLVFNTDYLIFEQQKQILRFLYVHLFVPPQQNELLLLLLVIN
jgi:hypothetical protein